MDRIINEILIKLSEDRDNLVPRVFPLPTLERSTLVWSYDVTPNILKTEGGIVTFILIYSLFAGSSMWLNLVKRRLASAMSSFRRE